MSIYKYTVANKEGKRLSGSVEAPDENTARTELNNLGFSILTLEQSTEPIPESSNIPKFIFEALDKQNRKVTGTIPAQTQQEAYSKLQTQYNITVTALWPEKATEEEIKAAKTSGSLNQLAQSLPPQTQAEISAVSQENQEEQKRAKFTRNKIEHIILKVKEMLSNYSQYFDPSQINEINKKINKILRIKNSTNLDYILATAEDLLKFMQSLEASLHRKGFEEKSIQFRIKTQELLRELYSSKRKKTLKEDILEKIRNWENSSSQKPTGPGKTQTFLLRTFEKIRKSMETPMEIKAIKEQIKVYNNQLWEFLKLYFKEPTPSYKNKVKQSIKTIWLARKKAKENLKTVKTQLKQKQDDNTSFLEQNNITSELSSLTGWLLAFYLGYYIVALYLSTKNFGLQEIPPQLQVLSSSIFKYLLVIVFLLHSSLSLKINYFAKSHIASILITITFFLSSAIVIFNF